MAGLAPGAALMFREAELDGKKLADAIRALKGDPERLHKMERAAGRLGSPQAASEIADVCTELVRRRFGSQKGRDRGPDFRPLRPLRPAARAAPTADAERAP